MNQVRNVQTKKYKTLLTPVLNHRPSSSYRKYFPYNKVMRLKLHSYNSGPKKKP